MRTENIILVVACTTNMRICEVGYMYVYIAASRQDVKPN